MKKKLEKIQEFISDQQEAIDSMNRYLKRKSNDISPAAIVMLMERIKSFKKINKQLIKIIK